MDEVLHVKSTNNYNNTLMMQLNEKKKHNLMQKDQAKKLPHVTHEAAKTAITQIQDQIKTSPNSYTETFIDCRI